MSFMATYKVGQGRQARTLASVATVLVVAWGCFSLLDYGNSKLDRLLGLSTPWFGRPLGFLSPDSALTSWVTPSLVLALIVFALSFVWLRSWLNKPSVADHLIGTELEMRRVKWPTRAEVARSGAMVVYYTFWLALIIFIMDMLMATVVGVLIGKSWSSEGVGRIFAAIGEKIAGS